MVSTKEALDHHLKCFPDKKPDQQPAANANAGHDLTARLLSEDMQRIDDIIVAGSVGIRARDLHVITRKRELIEQKIQAISLRQQELNHQIRAIMRTLEAAALVSTSDPLPRSLAEGTFAAQYLLEEEDLIPDTIPEVGLVDDAILIERIVARNGRELVRLESA